MIDINIKLEKNKDYFDNLFLKYDPQINLDEEQRKSVLLEADNLLVIAGAGSGKTTTMVAKVLYLIEKENYKETDIVVISFTRKVKEEIEKIIHEVFGYKGVSVHTFHALGLKIINASGYNYEKIIDEGGQYTILTEYIKEVLFNDKEKFGRFVKSFKKYLFFKAGWEKFSSFAEYHDYAYRLGLKENESDIKKYNREQIKKRRRYKKTIKGEYLKSQEEVDIANLLYINGIEYEYEKRYEDRLNYHPDFYIHQRGNGNYIEHFGVDENGHNGMHTKEDLKRYLETLQLKKDFFQSLPSENLFIVTYSKYNDKRTYKEELVNQLNKRGYKAFKRSEEEIYESLKETDKEKYTNVFVNKIIIPFIASFKQQGFEEPEFDKLIFESKDEIQEQLIILKDFFSYYQNELATKHRIDFEDMISRAYQVMPKLVEKKLGVDFKYLIIDEYQDISSSRLDLVRRMSNLFDAKVMAVGDDWQTIFGYSGSRIDLFKNFVDEMESAESVAIQNTYRNSQELIDIAGEFVLKNENQIVKRLKSTKHLENPLEIFIYNDGTDEDVNKNRAQAVEEILDEITRDVSVKKILFMGRYKKDVYKIASPAMFKSYPNKVESKKYPELAIDFLTIHQSKGIGYDYCVLLDMSSDTYGFPSRIEDIPVVKYIKPKIDEPIAYPEERRLFYVALTRTKNKIYVLVPKSKKSSFFYEIRGYKNVETIDM